MCSVLMCVCVRVRVSVCGGELGCFPLCIHGCDKPAVKRVLKGGVKRRNASGVQC